MNIKGLVAIEFNVKPNGKLLNLIKNKFPEVIIKNN
jgi:hypothetical protein